MPSQVGVSQLERQQGLRWGDGVRDDAVYFDGHSLVVDLVGQTNGQGGLVVRGLDARNQPVELFRVNKDGQGGVGTGGALVNTSRMWFVGGAFTGPAGGGAIGLGVGPTLTVPDTGDGGGIYIDAVVGSAGSGKTNGNLYGLMVQPNFVNNGAAITNLMAAFFRQYDATGFNVQRAVGIAIDAPIGATHNYSIQNSGVIQMRGSSALYFEQVSETTDFLFGGATGTDVYIVGSATGDLCVRGSVNHKVLWSVDAGATAHMILASTGLTLGVAELKASVTTFSIASSTVTVLNIGSSGMTTNFHGQVRHDAGTTSAAPLRIPHGSAPSSPVDGDIWTTTAGLFVRVNGVTVGPLT